jgi:hypothetical protein
VYVLFCNGMYASYRIRISVSSNKETNSMSMSIVLNQSLVAIIGFSWYRVNRDVNVGCG